VSTSGPLRAFRGVVALVVVLVGCSSRAEDPHAKCERLRDHLVELRLGNAPNAAETPPAPQNDLGSAGRFSAVERSSRPLSADEIAAHRRALAASLGDSFVSSCETSLTPKQVDCALEAKDPAAAAACRN
jgi:hypothetical protein